MSSNTCVQCGAASEDSNLCSRCQNQATMAGPVESTDAASLDPSLAPTLAPESQFTPMSGLRRGASPSTVDQLIPGKAFGDYELLEEVARGGMGIVYKAKHKQLNRIVALKMIIAGQYSSADQIQRFYVEAEAAAKLDHRGIVPIYEIGAVDGQPFYAMKFIEGGSLSEHSQRIQADSRLAAKLVADVARAVHHAHRRGILHRDIKPANILLDEEDNPLLTDLGLAKSTSDDSNLTQTGVILGTPSYMPPEQAKPGQSITTAADIYSLGAILYELLTGRPPHRGNSALETVLQVLNEPIRPVRSLNSQLDLDLELICMNCLLREPDARYASADDLANDLEQWLAGKPISIRPASLFVRTSQWVKHNQGIVYAILLSLSAMLFSAPILQSILGSMDQVAMLYSDTPADPRPFIYSFTNIPSWVSITCSIVTLVLMPTLGLFVTLVTRPKKWTGAALNGALVACVSVLSMGLMFGWAPFMVGSQSTIQPSVRLLATHVWPDSDTSPEDVEKALNQMFPLLVDEPHNQKVNYLAARIFADGVATGPKTMFMVIIVALVFSIPIVAGAIVGQILLLRGHRWWVFLPRYLVGWLWATVTAMVMVSYISGSGKFNGKTFLEMPWWVQALVLVMPPLVTWLVLRRWRSLDSAKTGSIRTTSKLSQFEDTQT